jgi:ATP-dependent DNA helicase RecG
VSTSVRLPWASPDFVFSLWQISSIAFIINPMNPALEKVAKYLSLEIDRNFDNRAVVGGLQRMLEPWQVEARSTGVPDNVIEAVVARLRDYPTLSIASRKEALEGLVRRLQSEFPDLPLPDLSSPGTKEVAETVAEVQQETDAEHHSATTSANVSQVDSEKQSSMPSASSTSTKTGEAEEKPKDDRNAGPQGPPAALNAPLTSIAGIGPKSAKTLKKLNLATLGDLLWHLPRRYDDYSKLKTINQLFYGDEVTVIGTVEEVNTRTVRSGKMKLVDAVISDGTGSLRVTWFNQPWIADRLKPDRPIVLSGKIDQYLGHLTMNSPEWELLERKQLHTNRIVPIYPLTAGVSSKWLRRVIHSVVTRLAPRIPDPLPASIRESADLIPLSQALQQIHFPDDWDHLHQAQHRIAFDEMFMLQLGVLRQKQAWERLSCPPLRVESEWIERFQSSLPYELTPSQMRALKEIRSDLEAAHPMNRLLQGDVGSGKTIVAAAAVGIAAKCDTQSAILAPTSILAEQHYQTLREILPSAAGIPEDRIAILLGATSEADKEEIRKNLESGVIQVIVGTHALLEGPIRFSNLSLAVIDEQHRFGVEQRAILRDKGDNPNLLVMTATPIPRSLALTVYGDLDLTVIDEMPKGRMPVETKVFRPQERTRAHHFISKQVEQGHQAFIIFPLVEDSEKIEAKAAVNEYESLSNEIFPQFRVGLLHGRMRPDEKDEIMSQFRDGKIDILVSTSVVEVGIDIPNATVMLIEGANRFGLAQLHQFRGRVGRGDQPSYCLLIPDSDDAADNERLAAMESTTDGFKLAEYDLDQRGPGEFLGTRQSGFTDLHTAQITDVKLIEKARREAQAVFAADPALSQPEHSRIAAEMQRFWGLEKGEMS